MGREDDEDNLVVEDAEADVETIEPKGCGGTICCNPYRNVYRFIALAFMCALSFGNYFCYDNPAALEDKFTKSGFGLNSEQYSLLYSIYSWPNVIFPLIGGYLIDKVLGLRTGSIVFSAFIMLGQVIVGGGIWMNTFWLALVGRFVFAVGGENLVVCQNNYAVKWFNGKELNTVFGVQLSCARLGSTINMYAMPPLYGLVTKLWPHKPAYVVLGVTLMIGGMTTIFSFLCGVVLAWMDKRNDKWMAVRSSSSSHNRTTSQQKQAITADGGAANDVIGEMSDPTQSSTTDEERTMTQSSSDDTATIIHEEPASETVQLRDILLFPPSFWLLSVVCVAYYNAIFPFVGFGLLFFETKFGLSGYQADICNSLIYLISTGASPICGGVVDYFGRNVLFVAVSSILGLIAHAILAFTHFTPYFAVSLLGVSYSLLAASLWPMVAWIVPAKALGTAYGVVQSIQNLGTALLFMLAGVVLDKGGYLMLEIFFIIWLAVALVGTVFLWMADNARGGILSMNRTDRNEQLARAGRST